MDKEEIRAELKGLSQFKIDITFKVNEDSIMKNYELIKSITSCPNCIKTLSDDILKRTNINAIIRELEYKLEDHYIN